MSRVPPGSEAGLTLVETLISLFLIAILTTAGGVIVLQSLRATQAIEARSEKLAAVETAISRLRDDFGAMTRRASLDPGSTRPASVFDGTGAGANGALAVFVRNGWSNPGGLALRGDLQRLEYRVEGGALVRRSWASVDATAGTAVSDEILLENLERVDIQFGRGDAWAPQWAVAAASRDPLPEKIQLTLQFEGGKVLVARFLAGGSP